jgi:paraquat-inducible protein A
MLAACPQCGKSPAPLWRRLRDNRIAAVMCVLALVVLAVAIVMPFIAMNQFGQDRIFSLVGGIRELSDRGQTVIAVILFMFSVIFPFAKLLAILVATSALVPLSANARRRLHFVAAFTGKYSLLDILVVAIVIVLIKFQGMAEARALPGTTLFCVAIVLSILAGFAVDLDDDQEVAA